MLAYHILGWLTMAAALTLGAGVAWFTCGGWHRFSLPHLLPPPVPKFALVAPATDPNPGFSDYVGLL